MDKHLLRVTMILVVWLATASLASAQTTVEYIHTDALGTPVAVTNSAGAVIERSVYEPYGQLINRPLTDGPGFTGHVQDAATGLAYMQQRYYDPQVGIFLSADPLTAYEGEDMLLLTRYSYANNNPYKFTDPDGRQSVPKPSNFNVDMSKRVPNAITAQWKVAQDAAVPKAIYFSGTLVEGAGGGLVGGKAQGPSGTVAIALKKGVTVDGNGGEAVIATPAGGVKLEVTKRGVEGSQVNASVVGAHAGFAGYEVGISSLQTAGRIDDLDSKTTVSLSGISFSWGTNKSDGGWAIGVSIVKPQAAASYTKTEKK